MTEEQKKQAIEALEKQAAEYNWSINYHKKEIEKFEIMLKATEIAITGIFITPSSGTEAEDTLKS